MVDTRIIPRANAASLSRDDKIIVDGSTKASISPPRSGPPSAASSPKFPARGSPSLRAPVASFGHDGPLAPEEPKFRHMLLEPDGLDAIRAQVFVDWLIYTLVFWLLPLSSHAQTKTHKHFLFMSVML